MTTLKPKKISTGNPPLDDILHGGLTEDRLYLVEGMPGTGKTTLALQFLLAGAANGETGLYVTLSETKQELQGVAQSHGWKLDGVDIYELVDTEGVEDSRLQYTMFEPAEIELGTTVDGVLERVKELQPKRVVFDSLSEMRLLSQGSLRYRRQTVVKKRTGRHERSIREFKLSGKGVEIGPPLTQFSGILTGVPRFTGEEQSLITKDGKSF